MTIVERAIEFVPNGSRIGLGSGRAAQPQLDSLVQAIKLRVIDRTRGQIHTLAIELVENELVVRGTASSYYVKQLALHAALDVLRSAGEIIVALRVDVGVAPPPGTPNLR